MESLPYVKIVQIRSYFWSVFSCIGAEYGDIRKFTIYANRRIHSECRKLRARNNSLFGHFSRTNICFCVLFDYRSQELSLPVEGRLGTML